MNRDIAITPEIEEDFEGITRLQYLSFNQTEEGELVERLLTSFRSLLGRQNREGCCWTYSVLPNKNQNRGGETEFFRISSDLCKSRSPKEGNWKWLDKKIINNSKEAGISFDDRARTFQSLYQVRVKTS